MTEYYLKLKTQLFLEVNVRSKSMLTPLHVLMKSHQVTDETEFKFAQTFGVLIKNKAYPNALDESNL